MANILERFFRRGAERAIRNAFNEAFFATVGGSYTKYDPAAKDIYLQNGYLFNPTVYSVVKARADKAKSIPFEVKRIKDRNAKQAIDRLNLSTKHIYKPQQFIKKALLETKAFDEQMLDFPMEKPNELQGWSDIVALYETFMATTGNFYLYMLKGEFKTEPVQVYVLPSHLMQIVLKRGASMMGTESPIDYYMLIEGDRFTKFYADEVIHVKLPNPEYGTNGEHLYGLSPLRAGLRNIQSSNLGIDNNVKTMNNSGVYGLISAKGTALTPDQADALKQTLIEMESDTQRLNRIRGTSIETVFTKLSLDTDALKPFEFQAYDSKQICNVLGWDDKLLNNDAGAKYDNVELAEQRVVTNTTIPSLKLLEDALTDKFLPLFKGMDGAIFQFIYSELPEMQQDVAKLMEWLAKGVDTGAINRDELRAAIGYEKLGTPEMMAYTVISDVIPLSEAIADNFGMNEPTGL